MAIYSCNISNVSRAAGSSSCATLSYIESEKVYDERLGETFYGFGRSERVEATGTLLPEGAPSRYQDPAVLFNELEMYETAANARTAKKIRVALPREFDLEKNIEVVEAYIRKNLTENRYAATYAIHNDEDNNNPHAHILVANRQINEKGEWSIKRKMEYALDDKGERIPILNADGTQKVDKRNRKQWKRINVEQNPLDKKEFLQELRESWATECNKYLAPDQQIDHRSNEARGIEDEPTIHEGYVAREIEKNDGISERCQINREIKERNSLLHQLKEQLQELGHKLTELIKEKGGAAHDRIGELLQRSRNARSASGTEKTDRDNRSSGQKDSRSGDNGGGFGREETNDAAELLARSRSARGDRKTKRGKSDAERQDRDDERARLAAEEARRAEEAARAAAEAARRAEETARREAEEARQRASDSWRDEGQSR